MSDTSPSKKEDISLKDIDLEDENESLNSISGIKSPTLGQSGNTPKSMKSPDSSIANLQATDAESGVTNEEVNPTMDKFFSAAQNGELSTIKELIETGIVGVNDVKKDNVTALHWAAINNQYSIIKYLIEKGAQIDYEGGDLNATPVQWACRYGLVYIVDLLLSNGASPTKVDAQGFNLLHLAVHSSNILLVIYILSFTNLYIDEPDPHLRTALHWAAYQGDSFTVQALISFGADVSKVDETHFTPLHWCLIRGVKNVMKELIENGSDVFAKTKDGKDCFEVSKDMNCTSTLENVLNECGKSKEGFTIPRKIDDQKAKLMTFLLPYIVIPILLKLFTFHKGYAIPKVFGIVFVILFQFFLLRKLLRIYLKEPNPMVKSPYLAGIFSGTAFWVIVVWLFSLFPVTFSEAPIFNALFFICAATVVSSFVKAMFMNPGYVPTPTDATAIKSSIRDLIALGKYDTNHFCINTFVRKPLRSKFSRSSKRVVAKFDHYCPWVYNEIGVRNHKLFVVFIYSLELAILTFIHLSMVYFDETEDSISKDDIEKCSLLSEDLCVAYNYKTFNFNILVWIFIQLIWLTSLCFVQTYQIFKGLTTFEFSKHRLSNSNDKHSHDFASVPSDMLETNSSNLSLTTTESQNGASNANIYASQRGCLSTISASVGLDQFLLTLREAMNGRRNRRVNPADYGLKTNFLDFWFIGEIKLRNLFFLPIEGENNLNRTLVDYYKLYEYPKKYSSPEDNV